MRSTGSAQIAAAIVAFVVAISMAWCFENVGTIDLMTGDRTCGKAPRAIAAWASNSQTRRPEERADLEAWAARHRGSLETRYNAFCQTPLHLAARFGREDLAPVLLAAGADVNSRDERGDRPLHLAAEYGNAGVVRVLLQRGADVNARGVMDRTPLARRRPRADRRIQRRRTPAGGQTADRARRRREREDARQRIHAGVVRRVEPQRRNRGAAARQRLTRYRRRALTPIGSVRLSRRCSVEPRSRDPAARTAWSDNARIPHAWR